MILLLRDGAKPAERRRLLERIAALGLAAEAVEAGGRTLVAVSGDRAALADPAFAALPCVERVVDLSTPHPLAERRAGSPATLIRFGRRVLGEGTLAVVAGPCAVESEEEIEAAAAELARLRIPMMRGGAFKPRTSPYSFQGLGRRGLALLSAAARRHGLLVVTEALDPRDVEAVAEAADLVQVGSRSMQNTALLKEIARCGRPALLKRGMSATLREFLLSAEYLLAGGSPGVILCERGIRTFETGMRNTLDLAAVPALKARTHLPVFVDPSHGTGAAALVPPMALAAVAAGADGLLLEVHPDPGAALSDGEQALPLPLFERTVADLRRLARHFGKRVVA